jgi:phosphoglycolate phosphatase-like HAD superfamily hydrolase
MTGPSPAEPRAIAVIDIDGVLADVRHRLRYVEDRPKNWGAFFKAARHDPPLDVGLETARRLAEVYEVVYLSGRPEHCRRDTVDWFRKHGLPDGELHLRPRNDFRPAREFKVMVLRRLRERAPVAVLVDDDEQVLASARQAGFDVLPATWMGEAPALEEAQEDEGRT